MSKIWWRQILWSSALPPQSNGGFCFFSLPSSVQSRRAYKNMMPVSSCKLSSWEKLAKSSYLEGMRANLALSKEGAEGGGCAFALRPLPHTCYSAPYRGEPQCSESFALWLLRRWACEWRTTARRLEVRRSEGLSHSLAHLRQYPWQWPHTIGCFRSWQALCTVILSPAGLSQLLDSRNITFSHCPSRSRSNSGCLLLLISGLTQFVPFIFSVASLTVQPISCIKFPLLKDLCWFPFPCLDSDRSRKNLQVQVPLCSLGDNECLKTLSARVGIGSCCRTEHVVEPRRE